MKGTRNKLKEAKRIVEKVGSRVLVDEPGRPDHERIFTLVAINLDDARIADNEGNQPIDEVIIADGEAAHFSTLPIKAITVALKNAGIPAHVSNSAGTFVCNHALYGLLHLAGKAFPGLRGGFIHIPDPAAMPLETATRALEIAITTAAQTKTDIKITAGTLC